MANKFQVKRTTVTGRTPNTTSSGNTHFIDTGELALNLTDGKMFSSNGTVYFEVGANLQNIAITSNATFGSAGKIVANGSFGTSGQVLTSNGTTMHWSTVSGGVSGSNTQIQFNDSGSSNATSGFTFNKTSNNVSVANNINAASFTTSGLVANVTALVPTSNTILLGNSIGRFVLSANTGDFTGTVTGTIANMSTSVNSALLTVGTSFIANTTGAYHSGTINAASFTTTGLLANTTALVATSNTILLGNTIGRFVVSANTINASGDVAITSNTASGNNNSGALQVTGGVGVGDSVYVKNRVGFANSTNISVVYQVYNSSSNSLDTVFG